MTASRALNTPRQSTISTRSDCLVLVADPAGGASIVEGANRGRLPFAFVHAASGLPVRVSRPQYSISHDIVVMGTDSGLANPSSVPLNEASTPSQASFILVTVSSLLFAIAISNIVRLGGGPATHRQKRRIRSPFTSMLRNLMQPDVRPSNPTAALLATDADAAASQKLHK
jgi:hypothetical protein